MKAALLFWLTMLSLPTQAQSLAGRWQGQMNGQGGNASSVLMLNVSGSSLSGKLTLTQNGASETYELSGQTTGSIASGTITFNTVALAFEMQLVNGQLAVGIGQNGQAYLQGQYTRGNGTSAALPTPPKQQGSELAGQWESQLKGRRLLYLYTNNGMSDKWYYDLCSNGTYLYKSDSGYSSQSASGDFSAATANGQTGTWRLTTRGNVAYIVFNPTNGSAIERVISYRAQGEVNLNGQRYFLTQNQSCK